MKQTAVEWFYDQLTEVDYGCINKTFLQINNSLAGHKLRELFEQAKAMEKEQIMDAFNEGFTEGCRYTTGFEQTLWEDDEQYYNETFKSE